jgi:hypothetical protein
MAKTISILWFLLLSAPLCAQIIFAEAEDAVLGAGVSVESSVGGYTGSGYATFGGEAGTKSITYNITAAVAGFYRVDIRYFSPFGEKRQYLSLNGDYLSEASFPMSAAYRQLSIGPVFLPAGSNSFTISASWGYMSFDNISFVKTNDYYPGGVYYEQKLWFAADTGALALGVPATSGESVGNWLDIGNLGQDAQSDNPDKSLPVIQDAVINYHPALYFNGSATLLAPSINMAFGNNARSVFAVAISENTSGWNYLYGGGSFDAARTGRGFDIGKESASDDALLLTHRVAAQQVNLTGFWNNGALRIIKADVNNQNLALSSDNYLNIEGTSAVNTILGTHIVLGANSRGDNADAYNQHWTGYIAEIIAFNRFITNTDRDKILSYLAIKYGITLRTGIETASYLNSTADIVWLADPLFSNRVTGIGRDDFSRLHQKQSRSSEAGDIVSMSKGPIRLANNLNTEVFDADKSFVMWADNGDSLHATGNNDYGITADLEHIQARIGRIWKVQKTGDPGLVRIRFSTDTIKKRIAATGIHHDYLRMLVNTVPVFASGAVALHPIYYDNAEGVVEFEHDFGAATGFYFSLGTASTKFAPLPVELAGFSGKCNAETAHLQWHTMSESGSSHFTIEHSTDAKNFAPVANIKAAGNAIDRNDYSFIYSGQLLNTNYFRLNKSDYSGEQSYSDIIQLSCISYVSNIDIFGNTLIVTSETNGKLKVYSATGMEIVFKYSIGSTHIDLSRLPAGFYVAKLGETVYYFSII